MPAMSTITSLLSLIMLTANFAVLVYTFIKFLKEPEKKQTERIEKIEDKLDWMEGRLDSGSSHFNALDDGNKVAHKALLALLGHYISGNNEEELKDAQRELNTYLLRKVVK